MSFIRIRLAAPFASFGTAKNAMRSYRDTAQIPTRSGIHGIVLACCGIDRMDDIKKKEIISKIRKIKCINNKDSLPRICRDYQNARYLSYDRLCGEVCTKNNLQREKDYLLDIDFSVFIFSNDKDFLAYILKMINEPVFVVTIGRANCIPSAPFSSSNERVYDDLEFNDLIKGKQYVYNCN